METTKITITTQNAMDSAMLEKVDALMQKEVQLAPKDTLHTRLLIEETLGMLKAMTGEYAATLWLELPGYVEEGKTDNSVKLHVEAVSHMDINKKKELLSVAKGGKNTYARGFMFKLGDMIENGILNYENAMALEQKYGLGYVDVASMGGDPSGAMFYWTLAKYKQSLKEQGDVDPVHVTKDELEKSIVASLAKDISVGVKKDAAKIVIEMELTGN